MKNHFLENLKKSLDGEISTQVLNNLIDEIKIFFQITQVKLSSKDPVLVQDAMQEIALLKSLLEKHPLLINK